MHYLVAVAIAVVYAILTMRAGGWGFRLPMAGKVGMTMKVISVLLVLLTLVQLIIGIQVRELIDHNADFFGPLFIDKWIDEKVNLVLENHARLIFILSAGFLAQAFYARKYVRDSDFYKVTIASLALIFIQGVAGSAMVRMDFLPLARVFHVFGGALLFNFAFSGAILLFTAPSLEKYRQLKELES
jgi:cytochrome c oxidase assembly protein subunit 15